ncbi:hypothetical protein [Nocardia sp. NPDC127526]|uniref:hypothetical protein n=1 Tax=Nocardia sp. NPDC127526 TaxID=3345393 RepID=UPI00363CC7A2
MLIATLILTTLGFIRRLRRKNAPGDPSSAASPPTRVVRDRVRRAPAAITGFARSIRARIRREIDRIDRRSGLPVAGAAVTLLGMTLAVSGLTTC